MRVRILSVGTKSPNWVQAGFAEYSKRLPRDFSMELVEISAGKHHKDPAKFKAEEGVRMMSHLNEQDWLVSLDEQGKQVSSLQLAEKLGGWQAQGRNLAFAIGGSDGLADAVLERANESMSLSALTLPHYLVRVMLAETLYRAWSINRGHPYHRG